MASINHTIPGERRTPRWILVLLGWSVLVVVLVLVAWRVRMGYWTSPGTILPQANGGFAFSWSQDPVNGWTGGADPALSPDFIRRVLDSVGALGPAHTADYTMWGEGQVWMANIKKSPHHVVCISYLDHRPHHGPVAQRHELIATIDGQVLTHRAFSERIAMFDECEYLGVQVAGALLCAVLPFWGIAGIVVLLRLARQSQRITSGQCPNCAYPTTGLVGTTCPECGSSLESVPNSRAAH